MHAFHSNWTGPYRAKHPDKAYEVEDFELLTTIISALKWQEFNGDIEMITDRCGLEYYHSLGLDSIWNGGISDQLEYMDQRIDGGTFWAAGKLYALARQNQPCVMLDTDFIIWEDIREQLIKHDVTVIHKELLEPDVYPDGSHFKMHSDYCYPQNWDWSQLPCNTAFTFFNNLAFKNEYTYESMRFMKAAEGRDPLIYMVFAEQRLLSMCAADKNIDLVALSTTDDLFNKPQTTYTHVWGHKRYLRSHAEARKKFCMRCLARIKRDYPEFYKKLEGIECLKEYWQLVH